VENLRDPDNPEEETMLKKLKTACAVVRNCPSVLALASECWDIVSPTAGHYATSNPFELAVCMFSHCVLMYSDEG